VGPPSYMRSVVDRNVVMRRVTLPVFCSTRTFVTVRTEGRNWVLSWARQIHSTPFHFSSHR